MAISEVSEICAPAALGRVPAAGLDRGRERELGCAHERDLGGDLERELECDLDLELGCERLAR